MSTCGNRDSRMYKMRTTLLPSRDQEDPVSDSIYTTPLRGNSIRFPRLRLLDNDFGSEVPSASVNPTSIDIHHQSEENHKKHLVSNCPSSTLIPEAQTVKKHPLFIPRICLKDRFIPQRNKYNMDAANYLLKKPIETRKENKLKLFEQMDGLFINWRKKNMHQLMVEQNVIPGLGQKEVLRGSCLSMNTKLSGHSGIQLKEMWDEEQFEDGIWKSKPRKRPLIHAVESVLDIPGFQTEQSSRFRLIDWSSKNIIATAVQDLVTFFDISGSQLVESLENATTTAVCTLKWSNAGDKLVICTLLSTIKLYSAEVQKIIWSIRCKSIAFDSPCCARCICWSYDDQHIVAGCRGLITIYLAKTGKVVNSVLAHTKQILTLAFSSNYRYLVSSSLDLIVRISLWPSLAPYLDITYFETVKAVAWHPYESGLLCIGGGVGDGSLSLWNMNKLSPEQVSYRHVDFFGGVEHLAWNKLTSELVVHWSYWVDHHRYTTMPVLASLDRVVDVLPLEKNWRVNCLMWNSDHTQLCIQSNEHLLMWNFFGTEYQYQKQRRKERETRKSTGITGFNEFRHFTIR